MNYQYYHLALRRHARLLAAILLIIALFAGINAGWMYANPSTETTTTVKQDLTVGTEVSTKAVVTGTTELYDIGDTVQDKSTYLLYSMPNATISSTTHFSEETTVEQRMVIVLEATGNGDTFWMEKYPLDETSTTGRSTTTSGEFNALALADRRAQISSELGGTGSVTPKLVVETEYEYEGETIRKTLKSPISLTSKTYGILPPESGKTETHTVKQVTKNTSPDKSWLGYTVVSSIIFLLSGLLYAYSRKYEKPGNWRIDVARHSEWLSEGEVENLQSEGQVKLDDISSVVDMAIDLQKRALYDPRVEAVVVIDDGGTAYFTSERGEWTPRSPFVI